MFKQGSDFKWVGVGLINRNSDCEHYRQAGKKYILYSTSADIYRKNFVLHFFTSHKKKKKKNVK